MPCLYFSQFVRHLQADAAGASIDLLVKGGICHTLVVSAETGATKSDSVQYSVTVASASSGPGYTSNLQNSLYFNGTNAYLSRSQSAGNRSIWTLSIWAKHSDIPAGIYFAAGNSPRFIIGPYLSDSRFALLIYPGYAINASTSTLFRDTSSWYHFVIAGNTGEATLGAGLKVYHNGQLLTYSGTSYAAQNNTLPINESGKTVYLGQDTQGSNYFNGYMANIHFIDGHALNPNYFAKTDTATGSWIPKDYDGTGLSGDTAVTGTTDQKYGSNGFHLDFRPSSLVYNGSTLTTVNDVSGRTTPNNWTAN